MQAGQAQENAMIGGIGTGGMDVGSQPTDLGSAPQTTEMPPATTASINTEDLEKNLVKIFGKDILIENKEDFVKLIKAAEDYNENLPFLQPSNQIQC
mgnify:CR=1 FL=1